MLLFIILSNIVAEIWDSSWEIPIILKSMQFKNILINNRIVKLQATDNQ